MDSVTLNYANTKKEETRLVRLYAHTLSACHRRLDASRVQWNATDAMRLSLCTYLVAVGARPAVRITLSGQPDDPIALCDLWPDRALDIDDHDLAVHAVPAETGTLAAYIGPYENPWQRNPVAPTALKVGGRALRHVFPDAGPNEARGQFTWVCAAPGVEIDLWSEWLPAAGSPTDLGAIHKELAAFRAALAPLGYVVQVRLS
jgi:hypothetical protein